ncbi:hypothetical protein DB346_19365 [Verrucomicrobia bacterium LW23]|nr:hypothetical protein DB346_19365 [Verrucomicrobia bacterium LW23]
MSITTFNHEVDVSRTPFAVADSHVNGTTNGHAPRGPVTPEFPLMVSRPIQHQQLTPFRELYAQGIRVLHVDATFSEDFFHTEMRAWKGPGEFDYSYQAAYWRKLLEACPDAKFCLRLNSASPPWWDELHPAELQQYADGTAEAAFQRTARRTLPSLASQTWRKAACGALAHFLRWLESEGWADRIWGLFLCYGITWEWGILGTDRFPDYSAPMQGRFREWLREAYRNDVEALRNAWGDAVVTFETAAIPGEAARLAACNGVAWGGIGSAELRQFPRDRAAADFQNCMSDTNCDYLLDLGRTVREVAGTRYKLGSFYGYTLTSREHTAFTSQYGAGGLAGGHHAFGKFLRSRLFDFNASPYAYADRDLGRGCLIQHFPRASCQLHGVRVYDENDLKTFLVADAQDDRTISIGQTRTLEDTVRHQRWALAQALCHSTTYWWTELSGWIGAYLPNFDHPEILSELRQHSRAFEQLGGEAEPESAPVAIIIDERSIAALSLASKLFRDEVYQQLAAWSWCGAPFDVWLAEDVTPETMRHVRLAYVFAPAPSLALRKSLASALCRDGRTVWWAPLTGWMTDAGPDDAAFTRLTGQTEPLVYSAGRPLSRMEMRTEPHANGAPASNGSHANGSASAHGANGARTCSSGWISLYGACAGRTAEELGAIAGAAGIELYGDAPLHVMRGKRFLALQSAAQGRTLHLPPAGPGARWQNVWTGELVDESGPVRLPATDTLLLRRAEE